MKVRIESMGSGGNMSKHTVLDRTALPRRGRLMLGLMALLALLGVAPASASEADLLLPDLASQSFLGLNGHNLLLGGARRCAVGPLFRAVVDRPAHNTPRH